jgi:hypothetical protein
MGRFKAIRARRFAMIRRRVSPVILGVGLFFCSVASLPSQEPASKPIPAGKVPNVAEEPGAENIYVPPKAGEPFTGKSTLNWTSPDGVNSRFMFMSMVARDSSGRIYFESRRTMKQDGQLQPRWNFIIIDPKEKTRTVCYVTTETCRINAFRLISYADSERVEDAGRATTMEISSLGTSVIDALTVEGKREMTTVAAGAYNNEKAMVITRDVWHSPELDLDVAITKTDPRSGTFARKIEIVSRGEPDAEYFTIPKEYTLLDNRPVVGMGKR